MNRQLSVILVADIVGYSRLVSADETRTLNEVAIFRESLLVPKIESAGGRVVKDMGDGWLASFGSTSGALQAAIEVQEALSGHTDIRLRIGLATGEVTVTDNDILGDAVNVAARLEALSAPGGILVSESFYTNLPANLREQLRDLGETRLKNMPGDRRLFGWGTSRSLTFEGAGQAPLGLAEMPTIAVLPFDTMSADPEMGHLAEGIADNLIAILSTSTNLGVTARNSSFVFKDKATTIAEIAQTLGVRYVVEGSLQAYGDRIRVTVQLIDAAKDQHMWAERYDRALDDIFEVQDDIAHRICVELHVKLTYGAHVRHRCPDVESLTLYTVGRTHYNYFTPEDLKIATEAWSKFHQKDSENPEGLCLMGWIHWMRAWIGVSKDPQSDLETAIRYGEASIERDPNWGNGYRILGFSLMAMREFDRANMCFDKALELNPSDGEANSIGGVVRDAAGRYEEGEVLLLRSLNSNHLRRAGSLCSWRRCASSSESTLWLVQVSMR